MKSHLNQAIHNEELIKIIDDSVPNNYFDWKITIVFYAGLHYLTALAKHKNIKIGKSHKETLYHLNSSNNDALMPINNMVFKCYEDLYTMARKTRYTGLIDVKFQMMLYKANFEFAKSNLLEIKKYCIKQGVK